MTRKTLIHVAALLAAALPSLANASPVTLRLGFIKASMGLFQSVPLYIAQQNGMFEKEGIKVKVIPLPGVGHMITALNDNKVDISSTATPYLIQGVLKGSDAVAVVGAPENTINSFVSKPSIRSFAELKGNTVGLSLPVDIISIGARELLEKHGLRQGDYAVKKLIGTLTRAKCLESGDCAATPLTQPKDLELESKGYHILGNSHEVIPTLQFTVYAARRAWASQHKDLVVRFARAMGAAYRFMRDPTNRKQVVSIAAGVTGASKQIASAIYKLYYEPDAGVMPKHGEINMAGLSEVIKILGDSGKLRRPLPSAKTFVDLRYLEAAGLQ